MHLALPLPLPLPKNKRSHNALDETTCCSFAAHGVVLVNNNLIFVILMYVNSTTFKSSRPLKTVATGILFQIVLKRILSDVKGVSILLLAAGATVSQFPVCLTVCGGSRRARGIRLQRGALSRRVSGSRNLCTSAFGGVYSELLLKKTAICIQFIAEYALVRLRCPLQWHRAAGKGQGAVIKRRPLPRLRADRIAAHSQQRVRRLSDLRHPEIRQ